MTQLADITTGLAAAMIGAFIVGGLFATYLLARYDRKVAALAAREAAVEKRERAAWYAEIGGDMDSDTDGFGASPMTNDKCPTCGDDFSCYRDAYWCPACGTFRWHGYPPYVPRDRAAMAAEIATLRAAHERERLSLLDELDGYRTAASEEAFQFDLANVEVARLRQLVEAAYREGYFARHALGIGGDPAMPWIISQARKALDQQPEQAGDTNV